MEELVSSSMEPEQNPDDHSNQDHLLRHQADQMGKWSDICVPGFTKDYKQAIMLYTATPTSTPNEIQSTMRHTFVDE